MSTTPSYHVIGPGHLYIQYFVANVPTEVYKLGIASGGVRPNLEGIWESAPVDGAGANGERTFDGVAGSIPATLTVWVPEVLKRAKLFLPNQSDVPGVIPAGGIGSFMLTGLNYFRLLIWRAKASATGEEPFVNFPYVRLMRSEEIGDHRSGRANMVWEVLNNISPCSLGGTVYNHDGSGWPGPICLGEE